MKNGNDTNLNTGDLLVLLSACNCKLQHIEDCIAIFEEEQNERSAKLLNTYWQEHNEVQEVHDKIMEMIQR